MGHWVHLPAVSPGQSGSGSPLTLRLTIDSSEGKDAIDDAFSRLR